MNMEIIESGDNVLSISVSSLNLRVSHASYLDNVWNASSVWYIHFIIIKKLYDHVIFLRREDLNDGYLGAERDSGSRVTFIFHIIMIISKNNPGEGGKINSPPKIIILSISLVFVNL